MDTEQPNSSHVGSSLAEGRMGEAGASWSDWIVVAWAVFAPNGNIRLWSTDHDEVRQFANRQGLPLTPLYRKRADPCGSANTGAPQ